MGSLRLAAALLGIHLTFPLTQAIAQLDQLPADCPIKTPVENTVIARAWHEEVINRRNAGILKEILASDVVHHGAGGYPKIMNATGIAEMMADFLVHLPSRQAGLAGTDLSSPQWPRAFPGRRRWSRALSGKGPLRFPWLPRAFPAAPAAARQSPRTTVL